MQKVRVDLAWYNNIEVEVPDDLTEDEAYDYILENYMGDIDCALLGSIFEMDHDYKEAEEDDD